MYKPEKIDERLNGLDLPEIKLAAHQARLKSSLLAVKQFDKNNKFNFIFMIKQAKFYVPAALILVVAAAFIFGLVPGMNKASFVQAKEMISESKFAISKLSAEARAQLEEIIKADLSKTLEEAYNANDLEYIGEEDISDSKNNSRNLKVDFLDDEIGVASQNGEIKTVATLSVAESKNNNDGQKDVKLNMGKFIADNIVKMDKVKLLKYTDQKGRKIILGLNDDNLPVMQIMVSENSGK